MNKIYAVSAFLVLAITLSLPLQAQKKVYLTDIFKQAITEKHPDSTLVVEDALILIDNLDFGFGINDYLRDELGATDLIKYDSVGNIIIEVALYFQDCMLGTEGMIPINNITFQKSVRFSSTTLDAGQVYFNDCFFNGLSFRSSSFNYLIFEGCKFFGEMNIYQSAFSDLLITNAEFRQGLVMTEIEPENYISIDNCTFYNPVYKIPSYLRSNDYLNDVILPFGRKVLKASPLQIDASEDFPFLLVIDNSTFLADSNNLVINIDAALTELLLSNNTFETNINFNWTKISETITIEENTFGGYVGMSNIELPEEVDIYWKQLAGFKIADLYPIFRGGNFSIQSVYLGTNNEEHADRKNFNHFIQVYQKLHALYVRDGDYESANACLIEMRDIEGSRVAYFYEINPTLKNWIRLQLSKILKVYTAYGTDPAEAVVSVVYIILLFAGIYFLFPSDWNMENRRTFAGFIAKRYLKQESVAVNPSLYKSYGKTLSFMKENRASVPSFMSIVFIVYSIVLRLLNAFMLSLNSFTTLGFGRIPAAGGARYLCVIQGLIGWFLLSLFSVSLIGQILN